MRIIRRSIVIGALVGFAMTVSPAQHQEKPSVPIGVFLARIEEGARIFTPVRLLPFEHPESAGHQFSNALQLFGSEFETLVWLGRQSGYELSLTLQRYPMEPSPQWPYPEFSQPPDTSTLRAIPCIKRPIADSPLKGLRAVLFVDRKPVSFIVDTRNLSLAERGMKRATSMGLDLSRADFLADLMKAGQFLHEHATTAVIFEP